MVLFDLLRGLSPHFLHRVLVEAPAPPGGVDRDPRGMGFLVIPGPGADLEEVEFRFGLPVVANAVGVDIPNEVDAAGEGEDAHGGCRFHECVLLVGAV